MPALLRIVAFELRRRLRAVSTWIYAGIFMLIAFLVFVSSAGAFEGADLGLGGGKVLVNSPHSLALAITFISYMTVLVVASISGQAVHQDVLHDTQPLFFTRPLGKAAYLGGRWLSALLLLLLIAAAIGLGCFLGSVMPFVDRALVGPNRAGAYLQPYLIIVVPNLVFMSLGFFGLAALARSMRPVYVAAVVMLVGYLIAGVLTEKIEHKGLAALLDPFGINAIERVTEYWTVVEKNRDLVPLRGVLLWNRLLWLAVGGAVAVLTYLRFRMGHPVQRPGRARVEADRTSSGPLVPAEPVRPLALLPRLTWLWFRETVKNVYFLVIVLAGVLFVILAAQLTGLVFGTRTYPVTYAMIGVAGSGFALFVLIIVTFYAGELVWREREARIDQIVDALPIPTWLPLLAKLGALLLVGVVLQLVVIACGIGIQLSRGYTRLEPTLYLRAAGMGMIGYAQLCCLALFVQTAVNHRYLGYLVMVLHYVAVAFMSRFGFEHNLYRYGGNPGWRYSDMNGFGPFLRGWAWFNLYWSLAAALLVLLAIWLWPRGGERRLRWRLREARRRMTRSSVLTGAALAVAFVAVGAFIFHNTNRLNRYTTRTERRRDAAEYERRYKSRHADPLPKIEETRVRFDLDPHRRAVAARGTYQLRNKTDRPVTRLLVGVPEDVTIRRLALGAQERPTESDPRLDTHSFTLPGPLAPGQTITLSFDLAYASRGFSNGGEQTSIVRNGTFLNHGFLPRLGYSGESELADDDQRRKQKLPPRERMSDLDDPVANHDNYVGEQADWISLEITACTSPEQTALAPGQLERRWTEDGRACFLYRSPHRVLSFFSVLSGKWAVRRDRWQNIDIEIHHHPGHEYNIDRMVAATRDTLAYASAAFGPYGHRVIRIVEFPRYLDLAQSLPATIPYSESVGFIAEVRPDDPDDVDYPTFITAHEVAHQWWAHQVVGANVQGATLLSETLAEYTGLMVMKRRYGSDRMKRFLRYDLDRYLMGRAMERKKELPLLRVENQAYIHYQKGGLAMYALAEVVGEEAVNRALRSLIERHAYQGPPYPTARALVQALRREVPAEHHGLIADLFEHITLYENRAERATSRQLPDGRYEVKVAVSARKLRADELGGETERPLDDVITVGALDAQGRALHLEKHRFREPRREFTLVFAASDPPARAGIDPMNALIDRKPDDNVVRVADLP